MISLIISFYKRLNFLELIHQSIDRQSYKDFEVILAEDNNDPETVEFIIKARMKYNFAIQQISQEDIGFRNTRILNRTVLTAKGGRHVIIDGD